MPNHVKLHIPATTANIGPGFDCLGLALDLWNNAEFSIQGTKLKILINGEGANQLPKDSENLIYNSLCHVYHHANAKIPTGLLISCSNNIPLASGLGSSAAATLAGVLGGNSLLGNPLNEEEIIQLCTEIEGHPDNIAPAYFGGLTVSIKEKDEIITRKIPIHPWKVVVVLPEVELSTEDARQVLPNKISIQDTIFNIGRTTLVIEALRTGDIELLADCLKDRLHQPCRLPLIPGALEAINAANEMGAPAALSGAGPSVVAYSLGEEIHAIVGAMKEAFGTQGIRTRDFFLSTITSGAE